MNRTTIVFLALLFCFSTGAFAQKPFNEGTIVYKVRMGPESPEVKPGTYTITIKGDQIRKEMKLSVLDYTIIINCGTNKVYSLRNRNGKKYAIELTMEDMIKEQEKFKGFVLSSETKEQKMIAGYAVCSGGIKYPDGDKVLVTYSKDWKPAQSVTFERFPGANFLPLDFLYTDESGMSIRFEAQKVTPEPVDNAVFRIPADYKIISNAEYKEMSK